MRYAILPVLVLTLVLNSCSTKQVTANPPKTTKTKKKHIVPLDIPTGEVFTLDEKKQDVFSDNCQDLSFRESVLYYNLDKNPLDTIDAINHVERNYKRKCVKKQLPKE